VKHSHAGVLVRQVPRVLAISVLGALFAVGIAQLMTLEGRWFYVAIAGLVLLSMSMMLVGRFSDALLVLLLFCVPLAGLKKFFFLVEDHVTWTNALSIGIVDFIVAGLYFAWFFRILVARSEPMPRLQAADVWLGLVLLSFLLSWPGAPEPGLVSFAVKDLCVHLLVCFYVSRHFRPALVPWLLAAIASAILIESALAVVQNQLGILVGLMLDRGAGGDLLDQQLYKVPGIEDVQRAAGTTYDSHALGIFMAMVAPFALVFFYASHLPRAARAAGCFLLLAALVGLAVSYSRSAWVVAVLALALGILVLFLWRERNIVWTLAVAGLAVLPAGPWLFNKIFNRLINAPPELLLGRFEQYPAAVSIWSENVPFGIGAGNYVAALQQHNRDWALDIVVHNVPLYIGAETGVFGLVAYYGLVAAAMLRLWRVVRRRDEPNSRLALAGLLALLAYVLDGMTNPLFREPVPYLFFWIVVGMSVGLANARQPRPVEDTCDSRRS
jgi:O-antigen ligase